jgi:hypothetical protein
MTKRINLKTTGSILDLDLFFQIWLNEVSNLHDVSGYSIKLLFDYYKREKTPLNTFDDLIYLPF